MDIVIPADARELDSDVQAYYRELRAGRRHERRGRWHRLPRRDGIVLPMLACCLILALISGTLLTVFTATSAQDRLAPRPAVAGPAAAGRAARGPAGPAVSSGQPRLQRAGVLPPSVLTAGPARVRADTLARAMLVIVPAGCACGSAVAWLAGAARQARASAAYVLYSPQTRAAVSRLVSQLPLPARSELALAGDPDGVLAGRLPAGVPAGGLVAILVGPDRSVSYASGLSAGDSTAGLVAALTG